MKSMQNPSHESIKIENTSSEDLRVALEALRRLQHGASSGEWQPFLDMLKDDLTFYAPVQGFEGLRIGKAEAIRLFEHHTNATRTNLMLKRVVSNGREIGFELRAEGKIKGNPYSNQLFMLFVIEDGQIARFREYAASTGWSDLTTARETFAYRDLQD